MTFAAVRLLKDVHARALRSRQRSPHGKRARPAWSATDQCGRS